MRFNWFLPFRLLLGRQLHCHPTGRQYNCRPNEAVRFNLADQ